MEKMQNERQYEMEMNRRNFIRNSGLILGGISLGSIVSKAWAQKVTKWKYFYISPPMHHDTIAMNEFSKEVQQLTNSQLQIVIYPGGELPYPPTVAVNIVRDKFVDGATAQSDFVAGSIPILNLLNLPMLVTNLNELEIAMPLFLPYATKEFEKRGIRILFWHFNSQKCIFGRGKPIISLNDIKGMKIRTFGLTDAQFIQRLGGAPVSLPNTEVATAIERGVVDAFIASAFFTIGSRWDDLIDWVYLMDMTAITGYEIVSISSVKALPESSARILFDVSQKYQKRWNNEIVELEKESRIAIMNKGKKLIQINEKDRTKATELIIPYWQEWASRVGSDATEVLQKIRGALKK